ncbi:NADPH-dependent F420 reductase [Massilia sp. BSC265]|uniref:NADPH-dependent F420 reductase n=1 Tax=Massilia sp. BSC265 TaxID=1549812 RepID=UPI000AC0C905|nr:NAD(P)-binding domain-containing protein [Massilia sp. BSC265]
MRSPRTGARDCGRQPRNGAARHDHHRHRGAGEVGGQIARAAIASGYRVVIANSRGPETLAALIEELGPAARAASAAGAADAGEVVVIAVPLKLANDMPVNELAGKIVLDTNNYMAWRDGHFPAVEAGTKTVYELRQEHLPRSKVVKVFTHIQALANKDEFGGALRGGA